MGFYFRKSVSVGPFRFNLSKSGIGTSVGIPGFRIVSGPRGNYIHMGRGGFYYRAPLPGGRAQNRTPQTSASVEQIGTAGPMIEIESGDVSKMLSASSDSLLEEMNEKLQLMLFVPFAVGIPVLLLSFGFKAGWDTWLLAVIASLGVFAVLASLYRDRIAKTVVLLYDFEPEIEKAYAKLIGAAELMSSSAKIWHVEAHADVHDQKYHAGADTLQRRTQVSVGKRTPPWIRTNIETISVPVGKQTLHFFPDRILVVDGKRVGAIEYGDLCIEVDEARFIEEMSPPADAEVVDTTWKYVNKNGGPDRRFNDNRELPICLYDEVILTSASGLNELLQISRRQIAGDFVLATRVLASLLTAEVSER